MIAISEFWGLEDSLRTSITYDPSDPDWQLLAYHNTTPFTVDVSYRFSIPIILVSGLHCHLINIDGVIINPTCFLVLQSYQLPRDPQ